MKNNIYANNSKSLVFDIETTGLNSAKNMVIAASFTDEDGNNLRQLFCDAPSEEKKLLEKMSEILGKYDNVITYNGNSFDLPFIYSRMKLYNIEALFPKLWEIDIYRWLKKYWPVSGSLKSMKQKSIEEYFNITNQRSDPLAGSDCISLYTKYLQFGDERDKNAILLHNGDDVRQLARIVNKLSFLPYHKIVFEEGITYFTEDGLYISLGSVKYSKEISVKGKTLPGFLPVSIFEDTFGFEYDSLSGNFELKIFYGKKDIYEFTDISMLDISKENLNINSGFLLLKEESEIKYSNINFLIKNIIASIFCGDAGKINLL